MSTTQDGMSAKSRVIFFALPFNTGCYEYKQLGEVPLRLTIAREQAVVKRAAKKRAMGRYHCILEAQWDWFYVLSIWNQKV